MQLQHSQLKTDVWHPNYNASVKRNRSILWGVKKWQHMPNAGNKEKHDLPFVAVFAMGLFEQTFQSQRVIFSTSCISCPVLGVKSLCTLLVTTPAPHHWDCFYFCLQLWLDTLYMPSRSFSQSHHPLQKKHQGHSLGHADTCSTRHAGLWLRMLPRGTLCGSYGVPLHVGSTR